MKLGEALTLRRRQAEKLNDLRGRIKANALVQEGDTPSEDVAALLDEYEKLSDEHRRLVLRINRTNLETVVDQRKLAYLISDREHLNRIRNMLALTAQAASASRGDYRYLRSEIKFTPTVDVSALRQRIDATQQSINALDMRIQEINWATDLVA